MAGFDNETGRLHKMVNGKKVFLTDHEENEIRSEWVRNETEIKKKQRQLEEKQSRKAALKEKLANSLGITQEDIELLLE